MTKYTGLHSTHKLKYNRKLSTHEMTLKLKKYTCMSKNLDHLSKN